MKMDFSKSAIKVSLLFLFSLGIVTSQDTRLNILFYFPDTLRAESFNANGNSVPDISPNFDAFARTGTIFEQCHVPHTQCTQSKENVELRPPNTAAKPKYHSEKEGILHYRNLTG